MTDDEKDPLVHHPSHYTTGGLELLDILEAKLSREQARGFYLGNILKYLLRADHKGSRTRDLSKAAFYLDRLQHFDSQDHND